MWVLSTNINVRNVHISSEDRYLLLWELYLKQFFNNLDKRKVIYECLRVYQSSLSRRDMVLYVNWTFVALSTAWNVDERWNNPYSSVGKCPKLVYVFIVIRLHIYRTSFIENMVIHPFQKLISNQRLCSWSQRYQERTSLMWKSSLLFRKAKARTCELIDRRNDLFVG